VKHCVSFLLSSATEPLIHATLILRPLRKCGPRCLYWVPYFRGFGESIRARKRAGTASATRREKGISEDSEYSCWICIFSRFHFSLWFFLTMLRMDPGLTVLVKRNLVTSVKGSLWQKNQGKLRLLTQAARR